MKPFSHGGRLVCTIASSVLLAACASTPPVTSIAQVEQQLAAQYPQTQVADNTLGQANIDVNSDELLSRFYPVTRVHRYLHQYSLARALNSCHWITPC